MAETESQDNPTIANASLGLISVEVELLPAKSRITLMAIPIIIEENIGPTSEELSK
jgi:hypothetical protein